MGPEYFKQLFGPKSYNGGHRTVLDFKNSDCCWEVMLTSISNGIHFRRKTLLDEEPINTLLSAEYSSVMAL